MAVAEQEEGSKGRKASLEMGLIVKRCFANGVFLPGGHLDFLITQTWRVNPACVSVSPSRVLGDTERESANAWAVVGTASQV